MELVEIVSDQQLADEELNQRHVDGSVTAITRHYLARESNAELGLLAVDINPDDEYFVIYEIFVPVRLRKRGIGTRMLKAAEQIGKTLGYHTALLRARTLDARFAQTDLESWYTRNGYTELRNSPGAMVKRISG